MSGSYQKVKVILLHDINGVGVGEEEPTYISFYYYYFWGVGGGMQKGETLELE